jgi:hypothetical protein
VPARAKVDHVAVAAGFVLRGLFELEHADQIGHVVKRALKQRQ